MFAKPRLVILEVYDTLLDITEIKKHLNDLFDNKIAYRLWMEIFMQHLFVSNCTNTFQDFLSIGKETMIITSDILDSKIKPEDADELVEKLKYSPIHEDIQVAISLLLDNDIRVGALTNVPASIVNERMERTGFISFFEKVLCTEAIGRYKPDTSVYQWALKEFETNSTDACLVTTFNWDIIGGASAGMKTVFLNENERPPYTFSALPDLICRDLLSFAELITGKSGDTTT